MASSSGDPLDPVPDFPEPGFREPVFPDPTPIFSDPGRFPPDRGDSDGGGDSHGDSDAHGDSDGAGHGDDDRGGGGGGHPDIRKVRTPRWDLRSSPSDSKDIAIRISTLWKEIVSAAPKSKLGFTLDTRSSHNWIFKNHTPENHAYYAGTYRGTPGTPIEWKASIVRHSRSYGWQEIDHCLAPDLVIPAMKALAVKIQQIDSKASTNAEYFSDSVDVFYNFLKIHPYIDGNGRISRLMLGALAEMRGISISKKWSFSWPPPGGYLSYCIKVYPIQPSLLRNYLSQWFII